MPSLIMGLWLKKTISDKNLSWKWRKIKITCNFERIIWKMQRYLLSFSKMETKGKIKCDKNPLFYL